MDKIDIISFEGVDGVGKTTISKLVYQNLLQEFHNINILMYHEPNYFKELFSENSSDNISLLLLFLLSRRKLLLEIKQKTQNQNKQTLVILDRYIDSTIVYQILSNKLDLKTFLQFQDIIFFENENNYPLITFILTAQTPEIIKRIQSKGDKFLFDKNIDILKITQIQNLYLTLPKIFANRIFYTIDTTNSDIHKISKEITQIIKEKILFQNLLGNKLENKIEK